MFDPSETYLIDGQSLTPAILQSIISQNLKIDLSPLAWQKVQQSRKIIQNMMAQPNRVVYGINTGFGNFADKIITFQQRSQLQINLVRSHAVGVGEPLPSKIVKKMTILRINTLAKGRSGIRPDNLKKIINSYNANFVPMIPEKGTVGASGDLAPLSHLALGMMGQGKAWDEQLKQYSSAAKIMKKKQLSPIKLYEKQGLALINGTQFMSSIISEVAHYAQILIQSAIIIYCFAVQIFGLQRIFFQDSYIKIYQKRNPNLVKVIKKIKFYLGSQPSQLHSQRISIQKTQNSNCKAHSILHQCESFAAFLQSLQYCIKLITEQMNSATDNPLVFSKEDGFQEDMLISAGNFHGQYVSKASDFLSMALFNLGRFSQSRIQRYLNGRISNLPDFLMSEGGLNSGLMISQYVSAALLSQSKVLVKPASVDSISTSASQEDHVSMGGYAARKARLIYQNISYVLGIQLICCLQSIDLLKLKSSQKLQCIKQKVREKVKFLQIDRYYGPEIQQAKTLVTKGLHKLNQ